MARTNYSYGKRLRELAKKQKREEKMQKRKERKEAAAAGVTLDEFGNPVATESEAGEEKDDESGEGAEVPNSESEA